MSQGTPGTGHKGTSWNFSCPQKTVKQEKLNFSESTKPELTTSRHRTRSDASLVHISQWISTASAQIAVRTHRIAKGCIFLGVPQKEVGKRSSITFLDFGHLF